MIPIRWVAAIPAGCNFALCFVFAVMFGNALADPLAILDFGRAALFVALIIFFAANAFVCVRAAMGRP